MSSIFYDGAAAYTTLTSIPVLVTPPIFTIYLNHGTPSSGGLWSVPPPVLLWPTQTSSRPPHHRRCPGSASLRMSWGAFCVCARVMIVLCLALKSFQGWLGFLDFSTIKAAAEMKKASGGSMRFNVILHRSAPSCSSLCCLSGQMGFGVDFIFLLSCKRKVIFIYYIILNIILNIILYII